MRPPRSISLYGAIMEHPPPGGAPFRITPIRYEQLHSDKEKERKKKEEGNNKRMKGGERAR